MWYNYKSLESVSLNYKARLKPSAYYCREKNFEVEFNWGKGKLEFEKTTRILRVPRWNWKICQFDAWIKNNRRISHFCTATVQHCVLSAMYPFCTLAFLNCGISELWHSALWFFCTVSPDHMTVSKLVQRTFYVPSKDRIIRSSDTCSLDIAHLCEDYVSYQYHWELKHYTRSKYGSELGNLL